MSTASGTRSTAVFFLATFAITWLLQAPALLAFGRVVPGPPERFMPLVGLGTLGPMLGAMLAARVEGGPASAPFRGLAIRPGAVWYPVALLLPGATLLAGTAVYRALGGHAADWLYLPTGPRIAALFIIPFGEEVGWRGYALPRLQQRHGAHRATVLLGIAWALWHLPMLVLQGMGPALIAGVLPFFLAGNVLFTWLYNRTGGSVLIAWLAHVGAHLNNSHIALPGNGVPVAIHTVGYAVLAGVLLRDRGAWPGRGAGEV